MSKYTSDLLFYFVLFYFEDDKVELGDGKYKCSHFLRELWSQGKNRGSKESKWN